MAEILTWIAALAALVVIWMLAGRFTSSRSGPGATAPPETFRGGGMI